MFIDHVTPSQKGMRNMKRLLKLVVVMLSIALALAGRLPVSAEDAFIKSFITSREQLNASGIRVGVSTGSATALIAEKELPNAELVYYNDTPSAYEAVAQGKLDAFVYDRKQMELALQSGLKGVHLLTENMEERVRIAVGISPLSRVPSHGILLNAFISEIRENGALDDMYTRWVIQRNETMPEISLPDHPEIHLTVGTTGIVPPYSYYVGTQLSGFDIELAYRFASWLGADVSFRVYDYGAVIPAAVSGNVDCIMANLNITPERAEALPFSDDLYVEQVAIMVRGEDAAPAYASYDGKRLGVLTGTLMEGIAKETFPNSTYVYLNNYPDCITALLSNKIDAFLGDEPGLKSIRAEQPEIDYIKERITNQEYSFAFRKNDPESDALCQELNDFLAKCQADGTLQELEEIWFGADEGRKVVDRSGLTGENGTIRVITTSTDVPFSYIKDGQNVGYDIDLVVRFCLDRGYQLELGDVDFSGRIPSILSGKYDFTTDMNVTPERSEEVHFSNPTSTGGVVLAVKSDVLMAAETPAGAEAGFTSQLNGKRIGVQTGTTFDEIVTHYMPDAMISYFSSYADMAAALEARKIDGFPGDEPVIRMMVAENSRLQVLDDRLDSFQFGLIMPKTEAGEKLKQEIDTWLASWRENGKLEELIAKWTKGPSEAKTVPDLSSILAQNGTLKMVTEGLYPPMNYYRGDDLVGLEIDLAAQFCLEKWYGLNVTAMTVPPS